MGGEKGGGGVARLEAEGETLALLIVGPSEEEARIEETAPAAVETAAPPPVEAAAPPAPIAATAPAPSIVAAPPPVAKVEPQRVAPAVRFLWQTDQEQRFGLVSKELGRLVGSENAEIVGSTWREVAERLRIDREGKVQTALDSRGQWSAIKLFWPVENSEICIAAELSAFPITETELSVIAALAQIGLMSVPVNGYRIPAATGTPTAL